MISACAVVTGDVVIREITVAGTLLLRLCCGKSPGGNGVRIEGITMKECSDIFGALTLHSVIRQSASKPKMGRVVDYGIGSVLQQEPAVDACSPIFKGHVHCTVGA